jgi:glycosyltransferase involved in cell wall biosynthesis
MTANSVSVADFYAGIGVPRDLITVIPNALPLTEPRYSKSQARAILGLADEHRVVGFVGRLAPQKRLQDVVWAFQLLHQLVDDARLVIIGSGPERDALAELEASGRNDSTIPVVVDEATSPSQPGTRDLVHYGKFFSAARLRRNLVCPIPPSPPVFAWSMRVVQKSRAKLEKLHCPNRFRDGTLSASAGPLSIRQTGARFLPLYALFSRKRKNATSTEDKS